MGEIQDLVQKEYISRSEVMRITRITPVTFGKWIKGSSLCTPLPHKKIYLTGWKSYRIFINKTALYEWLNQYKPWIIDGTGFKNWRHYQKQEDSGDS